MAEFGDFDIDRSIASAWTEFQARLSEIISMIDDSGDLTIGTGVGAASGEGLAPYVRFSCPTPGTVFCEAASNASLGDRFQLAGDQLDAMEQLGWLPPTADGERPTPDFWVDLPQEDSDRLSELAVSALRDVYGVQHPVFLAPDQLAEVLQTPAPVEAVPTTAVLQLPGEDFQATMPRDRSHLDELVDAELTEMYGHPPIRDAEGDIAVRVGSTMLFLRTSADGQEVVIFAAVVHDVAGRSRATEVLNDLNVEARWVKFQLIRDRVFVTVSVQAKPLVPAHLQHAVRILSEVADGIDDELAAKLHGRTTFSDHDESH